MEIVRYWRLNSQRYGLKAVVDPNTGMLSPFERRPVIHGTRETQKEELTASSSGVYQVEAPSMSSK